MQSKQYKVLLIGSGLMTPALIQHMVQFKDTHITVASNLIEDAKLVSSKYPEYCTPVFLDIMNVRLTH